MPPINDLAPTTADPPRALHTPWRGPALPRDPRDYQLAVLATLLAYGILGLDFEIRAAQALAIVVTALATQLAGTRWVLPQARFDPRSAGISALSLCLLLRTDQLALAVAAAVVAVGSKFLLRIGGKHVFNPTNFAIVALMWLTGGRVWISPGQWGSAALLGFFLLSLGGLVVYRSSRADVTWAFLAAYGSLLLGRALWLGQPLAIPLHQVESGAFLIFAFFMISDPKTTPDSRGGRILFAILVAAAAGWVQFALYRPVALLVSLAFLAPLVPVIDRLMPGKAYLWPRPIPLRAERSLA
jgi:Na+-transporting NADH:ubiquinone oxidoreductase subunit NqrB